MVKGANPNNAKPGDIVSFGDELRGVVVAVLNNTVVADLTIMENYDFNLHGHERQVVHYTKYKIIPRG